MRAFVRSVATAAAVAFVGAPLPAAIAGESVPEGRAACADAKGIAALHREWILVGWEKNEGDPPFDFRSKLGRFYDLDASDVVLYDDFDPLHRVARTADAYGTFWARPFTQMRSAHHRVVDGPDVVQGADLATSTLEFAAALEGADGKVVNIRTRSTLVWRCRDAAWRIVREHNSSQVVKPPATTGRTPGPAPTDTSTTDRNRQVVAEAFAKWAAGGRSFYQDLLATDVVWTIKGTSPAAGTYRGRDEFIDRAVTPFAERLSAPVRPTVNAIWADGDHVVVYWDGAGTAADGRAYTNSYVWIFRMAGQRAVEVVAFLDLVPYDDVLRRVPRPRRMGEPATPKP